MTCINVQFVTAGGQNIGLGHLRRTMAVAEEVRSRRGVVHFLVPSRELGGSYLEHHGYTVSLLIDHIDYNDSSYCHLNPDIYIFDMPQPMWRNLESVFFRAGIRVALGRPKESPFTFDLVVDGSPGWDAGTTVYMAKRTLLGLEYAILRSEFRDVKKRCIRHNADRILVTVGGSDPCCLTLKIVEALRTIDGLSMVHIVLGPMFDEVANRVKEQVDGWNVVSLHENVREMKALYEDVDIAITAGGTTLLELARTGTPAIVMLQAENQRAGSDEFAAMGVIEYLGEGWRVSADDIRNAVSSLLGDVDRRRQMAQLGQRLVDGSGVVRVVDSIFGLLREKRCVD